MVVDDRESLLATASALRQGTLRMTLLLRRSRTALALSLNKLGILSRLRRSGPATLGELAIAARQKPQSLTRVFAELEQDGLVTRTRDSRDRRQYLLSITPAGDESLARELADRDERLASAMAGLTETELQVLRLAAHLMERVVDAGR